MAIYRELSSQLYSNPYVQEKACESMIRSFIQIIVGRKQEELVNRLGTKGQVQWMWHPITLFLLHQHLLLRISHQYSSEPFSY